MLDNKFVLGSKILAGRIWSADAPGEAAPLRAGTVAQRQVLLTSVREFGLQLIRIQIQAAAESESKSDPDPDVDQGFFNDGEIF